MKIVRVCQNVALEVDACICLFSSFFGEDLLIIIVLWKGACLLSPNMLSP